MGSTLIDLLRHHAAERPEQRAYTFLLDGETAVVNLTYADLDCQARAIGALLQDMGAAGARVLLLYPPGLDYIAAFFGCLYAGAIAVPAYPPNVMRLERTLPRLQAITADAQPVVALTTSVILPVAEALANQDASFGAMRWCATDSISNNLADNWTFPVFGGETLAFLQYTSGSTAAPKGVMLTHDNLLHNLALIHHCFGHSPASSGVIWLPPYHDMGLIGGILQPLYGGFPVTLMSPVDFLQRPLRWLKAISRTRATTSGGPNFAYDLCVRKITSEQRQSLDLSSWSVAFTGAESIRSETLDRFVTAFEPCGFRREAFYPCYGLAEATLLVSGGHADAAPVVRSFLGAALMRHQAVTTAEAQAKTVEIVSCGRSLSDQQIVIVHPELLTRCQPGDVGEIWVVGPSVAQGYWNQPEETVRTFQAMLLDSGAGPFLRTGDLGFMLDGELFVTGRIKDLIIIRGRNYYPQDIELTVEHSHAALRPGCGAAFAVEVNGEERLVVVHEVDRRAVGSLDSVVAAIRAAIAAQHDLQVYSVCLLATGGILKTSSGKVQRRACRATFLDDTLEPLQCSTLTEVTPQTMAFTTREVLLALAPELRQARLRADLQVQVAEALQLDPVEVTPERPLIALGIDSFSAIELQQRLEHRLGVVLSAVSLLDGLSVDQLATQIAMALSEEKQLADEALRPPALRPVLRTEQPPLSSPQRRLWFVEQFAPNQSAYIIPLAVRLSGQLDPAALAQSLNVIICRHEILRTTFGKQDGRPVQLIHQPQPLRLVCVDLSGLTEAAQHGALQRCIATIAQRPFDLAVWPLLRVQLVRLSADAHVLLLAIHHIVADGWSMGVLLRELAALYDGFIKGQPTALPTLPVQYADFASIQQQWFQAGALVPQLAYWRQQLLGAPPVLDLPGDAARPMELTLHGAHHVFAIPCAALDELEALSRREGATLYMVLLSSFLVLLHTATQRDDLIVGTDIANRHWPGSEQLIGLFVNQLVLRTDLSGNPTFQEIVRRVRTMVLEAYTHPDVPFDTLVETIRPSRDPGRNPLFQVMFVFENAPLPPLELSGLTLSLLDVDSGGSPFDLSLLLTKHAQGLKADLRYNTDLFTTSTIARMAENLLVLLTTIGAQPAITLQTIHQLFVDADQRRQREAQAAQVESLRDTRMQKFKQLRRKTVADNT